MAGRYTEAQLKEAWRGNTLSKMGQFMAHVACQDSFPFALLDPGFHSAAGGPARARVIAVRDAFFGEQGALVSFIK